MVEFKNVRASIEDAPCSGRPKIATHEETIEKFHKIMMSNLTSIFGHDNNNR